MKISYIYIYIYIYIYEKLIKCFRPDYKVMIFCIYKSCSCINVKIMFSEYIYIYIYNIMYTFLRRSLVILIIKGFRTIVFIFIVISTTFRPICPPAFFGCLSNSGTFTELRTTSFIESTGVAFSDSVSHNRV